MQYFSDAVVELDPQRARTLDEGARFSICRPDRLTALFRDGGLKEIATTYIDVATVFRDFHNYWQPLRGDADLAHIPRDPHGRQLRAPDTGGLAWIV